jgi:hypothetical protein
LDPERPALASENEVKVRSIKGGKHSLRGGDFVLNGGGAAPTLRCAKYGLTAGHLAAAIGQSIYAIFKDNPTFVGNGNGGTTLVYETVKI